MRSLRLLVAMAFAAAATAVIVVSVSGASGGKPSEDDRASRMSGKAIPRSAEPADAAARRPARQRRTSEKPSRPERRLVNDILGTYRSMAVGNAKAVCAGMSPRMRRRNVERTQGGRGTTCRLVISTFIVAERESGRLARWGNMKLVDARIVAPGRGKIIVALAGRANAIPVRKLDGNWKIDGSGVPVGGRAAS